VGREIIEAVLSSTYGAAGLTDYAETEHGFRFRVPAPIADPECVLFRSRAAVLNELAIGHRLSMLTARAKCGIAQDFAFAIKSVETSAGTASTTGDYEVDLGFEVLASRRGAVTALSSTLVARYRGEARTVTMRFNVLPPSLIGFVRRGRQFADFADVAMSREEPELVAAGDGRFTYYASEQDRLSDGCRVDYVPALKLIDLALLIGGTAGPGLSAEFLNYTDPRRPFDLVVDRESGSVEFVQGGEPVAIVRGVEAARRSG
jgi:hypothetical protein